VPANGLVRLVGHVARANRLWHEHPAEVPVLAIFHGPQAYVTPSWYPGKQAHGKAVPTWNYVAVHVRGHLRVVDDADWLRAQLDALVLEHEASFVDPWQVTDAPADYIEKMISAIVGIEIEIIAMQGKWKLSQNQPTANRAGVIAGLHQQNQPEATAVAALMARCETPDAG
jgi:transcriptional regulator